MSNTLCSKVILSSNAYLGIIAETYEHLGTETGGIFLGSRTGDIWYVLEVLDPGPESILQIAYFEYDKPYVTHLANKTARFYKQPIDLLGLWHRHPGSMDTFSSTDDGTNTEYAQRSRSGSISALVNLDPRFRITMYHVTLPLRYSKVPVEVGDHLIPAELLALKSPEDYLPRRREASSNLRTAASQSQVEWLSAGAGEPAKGASVQGGLKRALGKLSSLLPHSGDKDASVRQAEPVLSPGQRTALEMLDSELEYLDSQADYQYSLSMEDTKVIITMSLVQRNPSYPQHIECVLATSGDNERYARINGQEFRYQPGIIQNYLRTNGVPPQDIRSAGRDAKGMETRTATPTQEALLDMVEKELDYLDSQVNYRYEVELTGEVVKIRMTYLHRMPYYPPRVESILGFSREGTPYARINSQEFQYQPGIIGGYIEHAATQAAQQTGEGRRS